MANLEMECGVSVGSATSAWRHRKECSICAGFAKKIGAPSSPNGWVARCGDKFATRATLTLHQKECASCSEVKAKNISERMKAVNALPQTKAAISKSSKATSQRPEIIAQRSENLKRWRDQNPEKLAEITWKMIRAPKNSKMEAWVRESGTLQWETSRIRCGDTLKQVDFVSPDGKVWVEVDGYYHFFEVTAKNSRQRTLASVSARDEILKHEALRRGDITLIRLSMDCFISYTGEMREEWLATFTAMLRSPTPGIWCLGKLYELCPWASSGCTIWKSPPQNTTSCFPTES